MGRLEKQIIAGALALVGILLVVVVYRGLDHNQKGVGAAGLDRTVSSEWQDAADGSRRLSLASDGVSQGSSSAREGTPGPDPAGAGAAGGSALPMAIQDPGAQAAAAPGAGAEAQPPAEPEPVTERVAPVVHRLKPEENWDPGLRTYVVRDGDTLGHIALRELGSTRYIKDIELLNEGIDPLRLQNGQVLTLPTHVRGATQPAAASFAPGTRTHTVVNGDTLWTLAQRYYGDGGQWRRILAANPGMTEQSVLKIGAPIAVPE